ncbi:MAG: gephyrin-like molybdotransferase Glp [Ferruginibacter sp.]
MISVDEAKNIIKENVEVLPSIKILLANAIGYVLAEDIFSKIDFPPFNQSNVDGYAIAFKDVHETLVINGEVPAGAHENRSLLPQHAMRIFTGAAVPENADTVVMQEKVLFKNNMLIIQDEQVQQGLNFRPRARDMKQGALALQKDEYLSPGAIGFLSALGITEAMVYKKPSVNIIITGNELQQPGRSLQHGEVYEANSFMLKAALRQFHFNNVEVFYADDNLGRLTSTLGDVLNKSDVVLLCGGISVGDYDFVLQAASDCGIEKLFHKVKQRPGKPLYFGKKENKIVFGLPGNPSSVLTCFYEYVSEALAIMTNRKSFINVTKAMLANDFTKVTGLTFFLKGILENDEVTALDAQESYRLSSYAIANCLIRLEENETTYKKGDIVEVHILPN